MAVLQPRAEIELDSFCGRPIGVSPKGRKVSLLVLIIVHLLLVFVSSKNSSCNWEWHFGNAGNATEIHIYSPIPHMCLVISFAIFSTNCL